MSETELVQIVRAATWAPTAHNMQNFAIVAVDDEPTLAQLGAIRATVTPRFIVENYLQLSQTPEELAARRTGMLASRFPPSWQTSDMAVAPTDATRLLADVIGGAPMLIFALFDATKHAPASEHDALGMMSLGCVLENMWLAAHASHLDVQVVSAFSAIDAEREVKRVLAVPEAWHVGFALRLGHARGARPEPEPRVRRTLAQVLHRNRFV